MSTRPGAPTAPPSSNDGGDSRLHIHSIEEMPPRRDRELAVIFTEMRRAAGVTREQIAGRLATPVSTIEALENGALSDLPDWQEVKRVVTTYAAQLGLDSRPILRRMESQIGGGGPAKAAPAAPPAGSPARKPAASGPATSPGPPIPPGTGPSAPQGTPPQPPGAQQQPKPAPAQAPPRPQPAPQPQPAPRPEAPPQPAAEPERQPAGRAGRILKGLFNWVLLIAFVGALGAGIWYAAKNPRAVWSTLDGLPEPVPRLIRSAWELVRPLENGGSSPAVTDPEKRKSDKLP